eukprot:Awhi_evm1s789
MPAHTYSNVNEDRRRADSQSKQARSENSCDSTSHNHDLSYEKLEEKETDEYQITFKNKRAVDTFARKNRNQTVISNATKFVVLKKNVNIADAQLDICNIVGLPGKD